jgi:hypothetical protein
MISTSGLMVVVNAQAIKENIPAKDSLKNVKLIKVPDSLSVRWENGKLTTPPAGQLKNIPINGNSLLNREQIGSGLDTLQLNGMTSGYKQRLTNATNAKKHKADSLLTVADNLRSVWSGSTAKGRAGEIYSDKKVKTLFDSLGIGKVDSVLALASLRKDMSPEDMTGKINEAFNSKLNADEQLNSLTELKTGKLPDQALSGLPPLSGMQIQPDRMKDPQYLLDLAKKGLDSLNIKPDINTHSADTWRNRISEIQDSLRAGRDKIDNLMLESRSDTSKKKALDSLNLVRARYNKVLDSVALAREKAELLWTKYEKQKDAIERRASSSTDASSVIADYTQRGREKIKVNQKKMGDDWEEAVLQKKPKFLSPFYFEGMASTYKNVNGNQEVQLAPGFGYEIKWGLSVGASPNLLLRSVDNSFKWSVGYRVFAKYRVLHDKVYFQAEDFVDPRAQWQKHNFLAGVGGLLPVSKKFCLNAALLYRVNNSEKENNFPSNWVFRIGLSSIGRKR